MYTDNPVADFLSRDQKQARWLERRPVCDCCGEAIREESFYEIMEEKFCQKCLDENFMKLVEVL